MGSFDEGRRRGLDDSMRDRRAREDDRGDARQDSCDDAGEPAEPYA